MSEDGPQRSNRRRVLKALGGSVVLTGLAGCSSGDGGGGGTSPGDTTTDAGETTTGGGGATTTGATPTETTGNTGTGGIDATNPGGEAAYAGTLKGSDPGTNKLSEFETLVVNFEGVVLQRPDSDPVGIAVGKEIDVKSLSPDGVVNYADGVGIPGGEYTTAEIHLPIVEATTSGGSEPENPFKETDPVTFSMSVFDDGEPKTLDPGATFSLDLTLGASEDFMEDKWELVVGHAMTTR